MSGPRWRIWYDDQCEVCQAGLELCASLEGFSLHAKVALEADDHAGRERLARYLARPPIASERLSLARSWRRSFIGHDLRRTRPS